MMISPPRGVSMAPDFGPSFGGPARPSALHIPAPLAGVGPPRRCLRHRGRACWRSMQPAAAEYRFNKARGWGRVGWCHSAPRRSSCACYGCEKRCARSMGHGSRWALTWGQAPIPPSPLLSSRGGVPLLAVQAAAGRASPSQGSGGATPCRGAALGGGRDACMRVQGAAPDQTISRSET